MRHADLHLRLLAIALAVMIAIPTLGRLGAERAQARAATEAATAAAAAAEAARTSEATEPGDTAAPGTPDASADPAGEEPTTPPAEKAPAEQPAAVEEAPAAETVEEAPAPAEEAPAEQPAAADLLAKGQQPAQEKKPDDAPAARRAAAAPAEKAGAPRSLYLAVGHGMSPRGQWQPGAIHPDTGATEVDANRIMVDAMREVLEGQRNLELHVESGSDHPNMVGSVARANAIGVDDCIEIHQDTPAAPPGAFVHWYEGTGPAKQLADRIVTSIHEQGVPIRHDWHRARPGLYFLRKSECRSVLVEVGRVGDFSAEKLQEIGRAMAHAYLADTAEARGA